jgi:large repetitive protein
MSPADHRAATPVNDAPVAVDATYAMKVSTVFSGTLTATDIDSTGLTYTITPPKNLKGTLVLLDPVAGTFRFSPNAGVTGSVAFAFTATDPQGKSGTGKVTITISR